MNNIDAMPPNCRNCPYWEWAESPWLCKCEERYESNDMPEDIKDEQYNILDYILYYSRFGNPATLSRGMDLVHNRAIMEIN